VAGRTVASRVSRVRVVVLGVSIGVGKGLRIERLRIGERKGPVGDGSLNESYYARDGEPARRKINNVRLSTYSD